MSEVRVCGTGGWGGPKPGDPDNISVLTVTPAFGGIDVSWTFPLTNPFAVAHTIIFRSTSGTEADPVRHAVSNGDFFYDKVGPGTEYFYWIQFVSINGTYGDLIGPASASARPMIEEVIRDLTGQIDEGVLGTSLRDRIDKIELTQLDLESEILERVLGDDSLGEAFNDLQDRTGNIQTLILDEVLERQTAQSAFASSLNTVYAAVENNGALIQTEREARIADGEASAKERATLFTRVGDNESGLSQETLTRTSADEALSAAINKLSAEVGNNASAILSEQSARTSADEALARDVTTLYSNVDDNVASLMTESTTRANADKAISNTVTALSSRTDQNEAWITEEASTRASQDDALARAVESVVARLDATPLWSSSFELGSDFDRWKTKGGGSIAAADSAYGGDQSGEIRHSGGTPSSSGTTGSVYSSISESMALNFAGKRMRITGYAKKAPYNGASEFGVAYSTSDVGNSGWQRFSATSTWTLFEFLYDVPTANNGGTDYLGIWGDTLGLGKGVLIDLVTIQQATSEEDLPAITAAIQTESEARIKADSALSQRINTTQTTFGNDIASVETKLSSSINTVNGEVTKIGALYTAKVDVNGLVGGFGVHNSGKTVEAGFDVDRFWVGRTNKDKLKPFIIEGGEVFINEAVINKLTFTKLRADNGSLIVQNGKVKANYIEGDQILMRKGQSTNFRSGVRGWQLTNTGGQINFPIQFSNVTGAGKLASKNSVGYNEVTGTKPPTNADRTASNTAYDTARVDGTSASLVRDRAYRGAVGSNRVNTWIRPNTTLINGNKIYTGDAYVDTLQIKGQAVTVPATWFYNNSQWRLNGIGNYDYTSPFEWHTVRTIHIPGGGTTGTAILIGQYTGQTRDGSDFGLGSAGVRLYVPRTRRDIVSEELPKGTYHNTRSVSYWKNMHTFHNSIPMPAGGETVELQVKVLRASWRSSGGHNTRGAYVRVRYLRLSSFLGMR